MTVDQLIEFIMPYVRQYGKEKNPGPHTALSKCFDPPTGLTSPAEKFRSAVTDACNQAGMPCPWPSGSWLLLTVAGLAAALLKKAS